MIWPSLATSESVASVIAAVRALRWRASFIARTTSGCGRPAERPITSVSLVDAPEPAERLLGGARDDVHPQVEQHQQVAQVAGEERHLIGPRDEQLLSA